MDAGWTLGGRWMEAGRTLVGSWEDAGWMMGGRLEKFVTRRSRSRFRIIRTTAGLLLKIRCYLYLIYRLPNANANDDLT